MDDLVKSRIQKEILIAEKKKINKKKRSFEFKELNFESFESFPLRGEAGGLGGYNSHNKPEKNHAPDGARAERAEEYFG